MFEVLLKCHLTVNQCQSYPSERERERPKCEVMFVSEGGMTERGARSLNVNNVQQSFWMGCMKCLTSQHHKFEHSCMNSYKHFQLSIFLLQFLFLLFFLQFSFSFFFFSHFPFLFSILLLKNLQGNVVLLLNDFFKCEDLGRMRTS